MNCFSRTESFIGSEALERLHKAKILIFGAGGVGSYVIEALARAGVGELTIVDGDEISETNINRQLFALQNTIGQRKVEAAKNRVADINPNCKVKAVDLFFYPADVDKFDFSSYDYVIDCIDTIAAKLALIEKCCEVDRPIISSMGTGNKLDPTRFRVTDIYQTEGCPLARTMRKELRKRGVEKLDVVFSDEEPISPVNPIPMENGKNPPGSISFVPPAAGLVLAGFVIRKIAKI